MRSMMLPLAVAAGLGLAACADVKTQSGPPIAGTSTGPGSAPLQQQARETMGAGSPNASGGQATITGTRGGGESGSSAPVIERTGPATGAGAGTNPYSSTSQPVRVPGLGSRGGGGG